MTVIELLLCLVAFAGAIVLLPAALLLAGAALAGVTEQPERFLSDPDHRRGLLLRA
jgi:hypothetical protein